MQRDALIKVWDLPVRLFHWMLVTSFFLAYITEDHWMGVHTFAGYTIGALILFRLIWGLIGTRHARFSDFVRKPSDIKQYIKDTFFFRAKRYLGHNPCGWRHGYCPDHFTGDHRGHRHCHLWWQGTGRPTRRIHDGHAEFC